MATVYKAEYSKTFYVPPKGKLTKWVNWSGTGGDVAPFRDILPHWVSGGAPGDPNPVAIIEWKGVGITAGGHAVVTISLRSRSEGTIGIRFILIKILN